MFYVFGSSELGRPGFLSVSGVFCPFIFTTAVVLGYRGFLVPYFTYAGLVVFPLLVFFFYSSYTRVVVFAFCKRS